MAVTPNSQVFLFLSQVLGKRIVDSAGQFQGKVLDLIIGAADLYPPVTAVLYRPDGAQSPARLPWNKVADIFGTTLWSYVHAGTVSDVDGLLPRPILNSDQANPGYINQSVANGWMPLWPKGTLANGRHPKVMFVWGANYLNQAKGQTNVLGTLWPKLEMVVDLNFQMDTTARYADIVLPAASFYEKFDLNTSDLTTFMIPFTPVIDPLFESKTDWPIWRSLAQAIQNTGFVGFTDDFAPFGGNHYPTGLATPPLIRDFTTLVNQYDTWASPIAALSPANWPPITIPSVADDRAACQWLLDNSPEMAGLTIRHGALEGNPVGDYRFTDPSQLNNLPPNSIIRHPQRFITASEEWTSDIIPDVPYYCFQRMTVHEHPLKTMTKRQQFYLDHTWILELGEQLPVHKGPIEVDNPLLYPLRRITPHGPWSITEVRARAGCHPIPPRRRHGNPGTGG